MREKVTVPPLRTLEAKCPVTERLQYTRDEGFMPWVDPGAGYLTFNMAGGTGYGHAVVQVWFKPRG